MGACVSNQDKQHIRSQKGSNRGSTGIYRTSLEQKQIELQVVLDKLLEVIQEKLRLPAKPTAKKIFTASANKFKASAFHQATHNVANTILIAYSSQKRFFGGFTPCPWKQNEYFSYQEDPVASSFVYTVQDGTIEVFEIREDEKSKAIMNDQECGPVFGDGHDIYIRDGCDKVESWNNLGKTYASKFRYGSVKSNQELTGAEKHLIRDYQIWALTM